MLPFSSHSLNPELVRVLRVRRPALPAGGVLTLAVVSSLTTATLVMVFTLAGSL